MRSQLAGAIASLALVIPIPGPLDGPLPRFSGTAAQPQPVADPVPVPNPALAPDGRSGTGLAAGNGAASPLPGPLGRGPQRRSALLLGSCSGLAFDAHARLLAVCQTPIGPMLNLLDPQTLETRARLFLGSRRTPDRTDVAGGTHFLVRADGTVLVPYGDGTLREVAVGPSALRVVRTVAVLDGERPLAVAAGFDGHDWVAGEHGTVVAVPRAGGPPRALRLGETLHEDLATGPSGTFAVSGQALYRIALDAGGAPVARWRTPLRRGPERPLPGRRHPGPGTPPVLLASGLVAVADGGDPARVVALDAQTGEQVCEVPVFAAGASAVEAHLVAAGDGVVVTNGFGEAGPQTTELGKTTAGGIWRVNLSRAGCAVAWRSTIVSPSSQPALSRATGLLYVAVKPAGFPDAWNLAALDWRTGERRWEALLGEGLGFGADQAPVVLGPDATAYAGSFGGVSSLRDTR